ncbi:signal peptidase I [Acetilactobacillus jinshanensis]|uniref:Signal peptidase I n=1 Tax=Acetilactobacillus jinshanensis TaxID=1720083 RepID=A0A4V1ALW0_9LACO|nr:signal peptidase I [Acetilactobacillus jinshanensis]QBP18969.1 signal peptidase I [Acetilactobacillus jinshanensis]URL60483.1 signal peptidase I [uncultured bacterium]
MKFIKEYIVPILIAIVLYLVIEMFVFTMVRVDGDSMQPNLENNERVMVWRMAHVHHLSVIVFNAHGEDPQATAKKDYYVKRVIGMPGDTVSYKSGHIYVNGKAIHQGFIDHLQRNDGTGITGYQNNGGWNLKQLSAHWPKDHDSIKVPAGHYFVLGDHRSISNDSRYWGFVPKNKVLGVVKTLAWGTTNKDRHNINALSY